MIAQAVGSGPYALVTTASDHLVFERFPRYKGALTGVLDEIKLCARARQRRRREERDRGHDGCGVAQPQCGRPGTVVRGDGRGRRSDALRATQGAAPAGAVAARHRQPCGPLPGQQRGARGGGGGAASRPQRGIDHPAPGDRIGRFVPGREPLRIPDIGAQRLRLTLGFTSAAPGERDLAGLLRDRLEESAGVSVLLQPDNMNADLILTDRPAWVNTALGWLQPYVDDPLPGSQAKVADLVRNARSTSDAATRLALLAEIQQQAAADLTVLPQSLAAETMLLGPGVTLQGQPFGPAWQPDFGACARDRYLTHLDRTPA